jgi:uncharacterized membrane protein YqjE
MADPGPAAQPGLLTSLRQWLGHALELLQTRLELLGTELEQEKLRLFSALLWAAVALLLLGVGLVMLALLVVVLLWEQHRVAALLALTVLYLGGGFLLWRVAVARLRAPSGLFALSAGELARDRAALQPRE